MNNIVGIYVDLKSGEALFSSLHIVESKPECNSFSRPLDDNNVKEVKEESVIEIVAKKSGTVIGTLFHDGPPPTGLRYCVDTSCLGFIPASELKKKGYDEYVDFFGFATVAGGCFWGMEDIIRKIPGVLQTRVGYTGGKIEDPNYELVKTGTTGHAEAVDIIFDPTQISYGELLGYFFRMHDPSTLNQQGGDIGPQYRSAIFYHDDMQKRIAEKVIQKVNSSGVWPNKVTTQVLPASKFYDAEAYHQEYLRKNPNGYTCHYLRESYFKIISLLLYNTFIIDAISDSFSLAQIL